MSDTDLVSNRRAFHDYEILDSMEAGIVLMGSEIKSLRNHGGSLQDAFVDVRGDQPVLRNASIAPYTFATQFTHEEKRPRPLLLHKREFDKLRRQAIEKGLSVIPLAIYLNKRGIAKVKIALAKGKRDYDKRAALKEKAMKRELEE